MTKYTALAGPRGPFLVALGLAFALLDAACDGKEPEEGCQTGRCDQTNTVVDAAVLGLTDGGLSPSPPAALQVSISVSGANRACGDCAVINALATGGLAPYSFVWSDDRLRGPGPHEVCDAASSSYSVTVTDTPGPLLDNGSAGASMQARAELELPCTARNADAGSGFTGCKLLLNASILTLLDPSGLRVDSLYSCSALDGSEGVAVSAMADAGADTAVAGQYIALPAPMLANRSYQLSIDLLLSLQLGGLQRLELWGTKLGCSIEEKLGDITFTGEQSATACLTPKADYHKLLLRASADSVDPDFAVSLGVSMTLCSDCKEP